MRKWMTVLPVAGAYTFSTAVFSQLPPNGRPDLSALLPVAIPAGAPISREAAALLIPTVALLVWILLVALGKVQGPIKSLPEWWLNEQTGSAAVARFEPTYSTVIFSVTSLLFLLHIVLLGSLLQWPVWSYRLFTAVLGLGMIAVGNVMPRVRPNWIAGLRTKRTLSDPSAWSRTHRLLGRLMIVAGMLVILLSVLAGRYALIVGLLALIVAFLVSHLVGTRGPATRLPVS